MATDAEITRLNRRIDDLERRIEAVIGYSDKLSIENQAAIIRAQGGSVADYLREKSRLDTARRRTNRCKPVKNHRETL